MMPVTHIAGALALTGWCLGPDLLALDALSGGGAIVVAVVSRS